MQVTSDRYPLDVSYVPTRRGYFPNPILPREKEREKRPSERVLTRISENTKTMSTEKRSKSGENKHSDLDKRTLNDLITLARNMGLDADKLLQGVAKKKKKKHLINSIVKHMENHSNTKEVQVKEDSEYDPTECGICSETYVDPVTALGDCQQHNFCKICLQNWITNQKTKGLEVMCPICNQKIQQSPDDLKINVLIRDLITHQLSFQQLNTKSEELLKSKQVKTEKADEKPSVALEEVHKAEEARIADEARIAAAQKIEEERVDETCKVKEIVADEEKLQLPTAKTVDEQSPQPVEAALKRKIQINLLLNNIWKNVYNICNNFGVVIIFIFFVCGVVSSLTSSISIAPVETIICIVIIFIFFVCGVVSSLTSSKCSIAHNFSNADIEDAVNMWCTNRIKALKKYGHISEWNTSRVTNMNDLFLEKSEFNDDISKWDVSNVTAMGGMFFNTVSFNGDLSRWNVSNVKNMNAMFCQASFNGDISSWNVGNVEDMQGMFGHTSNFNRDISRWDVSNVRDMSMMFHDSPFNGDISRWDVSSVTNMSNMFYQTPFKGDISRWNVSSVTNMRLMFSETPFDRDISRWTVSSVTNMSFMFSRTPFNGDISGWNVSKVTDMSHMFHQSLLKGDISKWNVKRVSDMSHAFCGCPIPRSHKPRGHDKPCLH